MTGIKKTSVHFSTDDLKHIKWLTRWLGIKQGAVVSMGLKKLYDAERYSREKQQRNEEITPR
jgi:hypothetical protein